MQKSANNNSKSHIPRLASSTSTSKDRKRLIEENNEKPERKKLHELEINNDVLKDGEKTLLEFKNNKDKLQKRMEDLKKQFKILEHNTATLYNARETQLKNTTAANGDVATKTILPNSRESSVERGARKSPKRKKFLTPSSRYLKMRENQTKNKKLIEKSELNDTQVLQICNEISQSVNVITKSCDNFKKELVSSSDDINSQSDLDSHTCTDKTSENSDDVQTTLLHNNNKTPQDMLQNEKQCLTHETEGENLQETTLLDMKQESSLFENNDVTKFKDISTRGINYEQENVNCHRDTTAFSLLDMETTLFDLSSMKKENKTNDNKVEQDLCNGDSGVSNNKFKNVINECPMMDIDTNVLETSIISYAGTPVLHKTFISEKSSDIKNNAFYVLNRDYLCNKSPFYDSDTTKVDMEISDNEEDNKNKKKMSSSSSSDEDESIEILEQIFLKFLNDTEEKIKEIKQHSLKNIKGNVDLSHNEENKIKECQDMSEKIEKTVANVEVIEEEQVAEVFASHEDRHVTIKNGDHENKADFTMRESGDVAIMTCTSAELNNYVLNCGMKSRRSARKVRKTNNTDKSQFPHQISLGLGLATAGGVAAALYTTYKHWDQVAPLATSLSKYLNLTPSPVSRF